MSDQVTDLGVELKLVEILTRLSRMEGKLDFLLAEGARQ